MFTLLKETPLGRRGRLQTAHGPIETPFFFPVGTGGAMRGITLEDLHTLGAQVLLCNTYHLHLQPGEKLIEEAGGLHQFIGWQKPILTDSGGFQVFSLRGISAIVDRGVEFRSHIDGSTHFIGPEESIRIQHALGADIIMCFDQCPPSTAPREEQIVAVERTLRWAKECKRIHQEFSKQDAKSPPLLFGIVQGGLERDLREKCADELIAIGFDGYALGGLAVGESEEEMYSVLDAVLPHLPNDQPRYLMGVGRVEQMKQAITKGIDMFDCVLPMREARHGTLYVSDGTKLRITQEQHKSDHSPIDADSPSALSRHHSRSYLRYLFQAKERYAETIACMQNMGIVFGSIESIRKEMDNYE